MGDELNTDEDTGEELKMEDEKREDDARDEEKMEDDRFDELRMDDEAREDEKGEDDTALLLKVHRPAPPKRAPVPVWVYTTRSGKLPCARRRWTRKGATAERAEAGERAEVGEW